MSRNIYGISWLWVYGEAQLIARGNIFAIIHPFIFISAHIFSISNLYRISLKTSLTLQWRHNAYDGVSNHKPHDCLLNRLFRRRSKKTSKIRVAGLCAGISPVTGEFPAQMASNAENVSIWWCHHEWHRVIMNESLFVKVTRPFCQTSRPCFGPFI